MRAKQFLISGRVQGVCFRSEAKRRADLLTLTGWVRNTDNGDVEILAQGEEEALLNFERWCQRGPLAAEVRHVSTHAVLVSGSLASFDIRSTEA